MVEQKTNPYLNGTKWVVAGIYNDSVITTQDFNKDMPWIFNSSGTVGCPNHWSGTWSYTNENYTNKVCSNIIDSNGKILDSFTVVFLNDDMFIAYKDSHLYRFGKRFDKNISSNVYNESKIDISSYIKGTNWVVAGIYNDSVITTQDFNKDMPWIFNSSGTVGCPNHWSGTWSYTNENYTNKVSSNIIDSNGKILDSFTVVFLNDDMFIAYKDSHLYRFGRRFNKDNQNNGTTQIDNSDEATKIDNSIYNLNYNVANVLKVNGSARESFVPIQSEMNNGTFIEIKREVHSLEAGNVDISVPNANKSVTYPGALLKANSNYVSGLPELISVNRAPITLTIDLPGLEVSHIDVKEAEYSNVTEAVTKLVNTWYTNCKSKGFEAPANIEYSASLIFDENQMRVQFGCDVSYLSNKLSLDFGLAKAAKKSYYVVKYKQLYYTVSAEAPVKPSNLFDKSVTLNELVTKGVSNNTPPLMVSDVQYGREIYFCFESDMSSLDLESKLSGTISKNGVDTTAHASVKNSINKKSIKVSGIVLGGANVDFTPGNFTDDDVMKNINALVKPINLSQSNSATPISYKTIFVKDNSTAKISGATSYISTSYKEFPQGKIILAHSGAYVAAFHVSWTEVNYDSNGTPQYTNKSWDGSGRNVTAGFRTEIPLPGNTKEISIVAKGATGLIWEKWRTSINEPHLPMAHTTTVKISGTTLSQHGEILQSE